MNENVIEKVFGKRVFNDDAMQEYLPKKTYAAPSSEVRSLMRRSPMWSPTV